MMGFSGLVLAAAGLFFSATAPSAAQTPVQADAPEVAIIRIGTEGSNPPFNYFEGDELKGFDVDLAKAVCMRLARRCEFVTRSIDQLPLALKRREIDVIVSALPLPEAKRAKVFLTKPYLALPAVFVRHKDDAIGPLDPKALAGKVVAVIADSPQAAFLAAQYPEAKAKPFGTLEEAASDLSSRQVDLALFDHLAAIPFLKTKEGEDLRLAGPEIHNDTFFAGTPIACRKSDAVLCSEFERVIGTLIADGTYADINARYVEFPLLDMPRTKSAMR